MDRLKYRVWDKGRKCFFNDDEVVIYPNGEESFFNADYDFTECVVEQCTGLKDKNGKLIFEGDIARIIEHSSRKEPFIGFVEYTKIASFEVNVKGFYMYLHNPQTPENVSMVEKMFGTSLREIEVIGNIHENPELLEKKENEK